MTTRFVALLMLTLTTLSAEGGDARGKRLWKWSVGVLAAANAADTMTSMGRYELNPVLGAGRFGPRATGLKIGISAAMIGAQYLILRRRPQAMRKAAFVNFAMAGATAGVAALNTRH
jgi:hypothetical protein